MSVRFPGIQSVLGRLLAYCEAHGWSGYDPYDALNSRLLHALPLLDRKWIRLGLTQCLKRSPINLRPLLRVPPSENPKALGLCLSAGVKLASRNWPGARERLDSLVQRLAALSAAGTDASCWGYSFPWQTRSVLVPRGEPNLVCTVFVANALLDAFEFDGRRECGRMADRAAAYLNERLYWEDGLEAGFSYPAPTVRNQVHNANLLGAALLCRVAHYTGQVGLLDRALKVARHSVAQQRPDGSWPYGEAASQAWIDHFHTGFNLSALRVIAACAPTDEFTAAIHRGFEFYCRRFFTAEGVVRYYHNRTYPIDVHCVAQALLTLTEFRDTNPEAVQMAGQVYRWAIDHLWDERGFFYYRKLPGLTIRTPYMRWSQAWMLLALASLMMSEAEAPTGNGDGN